MFESKRSRASSESPLVRAVARLAKLASGVFSAASTKPEKAKTPTAKTVGATLGAVVRIDVDVIFGQVARPESGGSFPLAGDPEDDRDVGVIETHLHIGFVERGGEAVAANLHIL